MTRIELSADNCVVAMYRKINRNIYLLFVLSGFLLNGCGDSPEHSRAKKLLSDFSCPSYNGQWGLLMKNDLEKAEIFLDKYEKGLHLFNIPIDQVIEIQLRQFRIACEASESEAKKR